MCFCKCLANKKYSLHKLQHRTHSYHKRCAFLLCAFTNVFQTKCIHNTSYNSGHILIIDKFCALISCAFSNAFFFIVSTWFLQLVILTFLHLPAFFTFIGSCNLSERVLFFPFVLFARTSTISEVFSWSCRFTSMNPADALIVPFFGVHDFAPESSIGFSLFTIEERFSFSGSLQFLAPLSRSSPPSPPCWCPPSHPPSPPPRHPVVPSPWQLLELGIFHQV